MSVPLWPSSALAVAPPASETTRMTANTQAATNDQRSRRKRANASLHDDRARGGACTPTAAGEATPNRCVRWRRALKLKPLGGLVRRSHVDRRAPFGRDVALADDVRDIVVLDVRDDPRCEAEPHRVGERACEDPVHLAAGRTVDPAARLLLRWLSEATHDLLRSVPE